MSVRSPLGATPQQGNYRLETTRTARRAAAWEPLGTLALAGLLVSGLLIAISAADTDSLLPLSVRPIPTSLAGPFGAAGIDIGGVGVMITLAAIDSGASTYDRAVNSGPYTDGVLTHFAPMNG